MKKVFVYKSTDLESHELEETWYPFEPYEFEEKKDYYFTMSRNHHSPIDDELLDMMKKNISKHQNSGCGWKYMKIIDRTFDGYITSSTGACKWDIISGAAMLECLGGINTGLEGELYHFGPDAEHVNRHAQFAMNNVKAHSKFVETFKTYQGW